MVDAALMKDMSLDLGYIMMTRFPADLIKAKRSVSFCSVSRLSGDA